MWAFDSNFYQIYPLGFCGAPAENDGQSAPAEPGLSRFEEWIPHLLKLGHHLAPVFKYILSYQTFPPGTGQHCQKYGLQICGKSGINPGLQPPKRVESPLAA